MNKKTKTAIKTKNLKVILSHIYTALISITFMLTLMNNKNWWLLVITIVAMIATVCIIDHDQEEQSNV